MLLVPAALPTIDVARAILVALRPMRLGLTLTAGFIRTEEAIVISQTVEYALRAIATLAQNHGTPQTAQQIAEATHVPGPYLSKLMQGLVRGKLVTSRRGKHGGFLLAKSPDELTIWDVIEVVEPIQRTRKYPRDVPPPSAELCALHARLDKAMALVEQAFRATRLSDLTSDGAATEDAAPKQASPSQQVAFSSPSDNGD